VDALTTVRHGECSICMSFELDHEEYTLNLKMSPLMPIKVIQYISLKKDHSETPLICLDLRNHSDEGVSVVSSPVRISDK